MQINYRGLKAQSWCLIQSQINQKVLLEKGKRSWGLISTSVEEKPQWKTQNNIEMWNGPEKEASKTKKDYFSKILSVGTMEDAVKLHDGGFC